MKKFSIKLTACAVSLIMALFAIKVIPLTAENATDPYGTYDDGIVLKAYQIAGVAPSEKAENHDFEQGFRYWGTSKGGSPNQFAKLIKENNNTYIKLTPKNGYDSIQTAPFYVEKAKAGDKVSILLDWKGDGKLQASINQYINKSNGTKTLAKGWETDVLKEATASDEWNTSLISLAADATVADIDGNIPYFNIVVQARDKTDIVTYVDNIRVVKVDDSGNVYDFSGNLLFGDPQTEPDGYGTESGGIEGNKSTLHALPATNGLQNGNFAAGLRYWGVHSPGTPHTASLSLGLDGADKYGVVKITGYAGLYSVPFTIEDSKEGDLYGIRFKMKKTSGEGDIRVWLMNKDIDGHSLASSINVTPTDDWQVYETTKANSKGLEVFTDKKNVNDGKLLLQLAFTGNNISQDGIDICVDDIEIFKFGNSGGSTPSGETDSDGYGTKSGGIARETITTTMNPTDGPKNLDFEEGFRYWGTYWTDSVATDFAKLVTENGNTYVQLTPDANDGSGGWRGPSTALFKLKNVKVGDRLSVLYDWKGDTDFQIKLAQLQVIDTTKEQKAAADPTANLKKVGATEEDWNTSYSYITAPVVEDKTDDGEFVFFIMMQSRGNPDIVSYIDNIRIVKVSADDEHVYDLDGKEIIFENDDPDDPGTDDPGTDDPGTDDPGTDEPEPDEPNNNNNSGNSGNNSTNNGSGSDNNASGNTGNSGNNQSDTGNNSYNNGNSGYTNNSQTTTSGKTDKPDYDIDEIYSSVEKLKNGESVKFIPLISLENSNSSSINAYIAVSTLSDKEKEALTSLTKEELENYLIVQNAILKTFSLAPNSENAKAFKELGGNISKTLPLSFTGHINLDFTLNIRIMVGNGTLDKDESYYVYHCNPDTKLIENLGKAYLEEENGDIYLTFRTKSFSDFFINPENLKGAVDLSAKQVNNTESSSNIVWYVIGGVAGAAVLAAAVVLTVLIVKKKKSKIKI